MYYDKYDWREYRGDVVWLGGMLYKGYRIEIQPEDHSEEPLIRGTITMESPFCISCMEARKELKFHGDFIPRIEGERGVILLKHDLEKTTIYEVIHINDRFAKSDWYEWITGNGERYYITDRKAKYLVGEKELRKLYQEVGSKIEVKGGTLRLAGEGFNNKIYRGEIRWFWGNAEREEHGEEELNGDKLLLSLDTPRGKYITGLAMLYKDGKEVANAYGVVYWYVRRGKGMAVLTNFNASWDNKIMAMIFINLKDEEEWEIPKMEGRCYLK